MVRRKKNKKENPPTNQISYSGPIMIPGSNEENETSVVNLNFTGAISSNSSGVIDSYYSNDPASYALADWTSIKGVWTEYRVLGFEVRFFPFNRYSKTTTLCTPMIVCVDRQSNALMGSYQTAMSHASAKVVSLEDPWKETWKMKSVEEASYKSTNATSASGWIKYYADSLSVSQGYGRFFVYILVQLRGRM